MPLKDLETVFMGQDRIRSHSASFGGVEWELLVDKAARAAGGHSLGLYAVPHHPTGLQLQASAQAAIMLMNITLVCVAPEIRAARFSEALTGACVLEGGLGVVDFWGTSGMTEWQPQLFEKWADSKGMLKLLLNVRTFM